MSTVLVDRIKFRLDGELVRITTTSGSEEREVVCKMRHFRRRLRDAERVVAEWEARQAEVVDLARVKGRRGKH